MNKDLLEKINRFVIFLSLFIIGFMALLFKEYKPLVSGYIFGTLISILSLYLIRDSINKVLIMDPIRGKRKARVNYLIRYLIYAVVLIVAAKADYISFLTTVLGLSMVKISIVLLNIIDKDFYT